MSCAIVLSDLGFTWPDGSPVCTHLNAVLPPGRTGLVGLNGSGKSTFLRLIAGRLAPTTGSVTVSGQVGYLPQDLTLDTARRVEEILGIAQIREAIRAVEGGDTSAETFAAVGDDWDVDERARATLDQLGLTEVGLDRRVGELSGGESVLLALAALLLSRPDVLLLDEPTNNLDRTARAQLYAALDGWTGVAVVVSHDRELLAWVDQIAELRDGEIRVYGGNFDAYEEAVAAEQEAAQRGLRTAESDLRRQRRDLVGAQVALDRRARFGRKKSATKREPKIVMNARKREAQVSAGKYRELHEQKVSQARGRVAVAKSAVRDDDEIRIDLPGTEVPAGRGVLRATSVALPGGQRIGFEVWGPERIALTGRNGAGKTTLLRSIAGELPGEVSVQVPMGFLAQRLDVLDDALSPVDNVRRVNPSATENQIRAQLARLLLRDGLADREVGQLSGGERFRAAMGAVLLAERSPQLLLLDEPTNNLDLASARQLVQALQAYRGALIVAGHDLPFLREIEPTRWLELP